MMSRNYGLDLARILAAFMVMAGHLIFGGSMADGRPYSDWSGIHETLPLFNHNKMWMLDSYLLQNYGTALAIIGVSLFFLISGWLMPPMMKKYSRQSFILNRIFRIFPMLIFAVALAAVIQYFWGDRTTLSGTDVLATATLSANLLGKPLSLGVAWTLIIEFEFYILLFLLGKLTQIKILSLCTLLVVLSFFNENFGITSQSITNDTYYILFMFIGSSARLAYDNYKTTGRKIHLLPPIFCSMIYLINRYIFVNILMLNPAQDINFISFSITILMFLIFSLVGEYTSKSKYTRLIIEQSSELTYSIYLIHLPIGIFLISRLRHDLSSDYLTLATTVMLIVSFSFFTYKKIELPCMRAFKKINPMRNKASRDESIRSET